MYGDVWQVHGSVLQVLQRRHQRWTQEHDRVQRFNHDHLSWTIKLKKWTKRQYIALVVVMTIGWLSLLWQCFGHFVVSTLICFSVILSKNLFLPTKKLFSFSSIFSSINGLQIDVTLKVHPTTVPSDHQASYQVNKGRHNGGVVVPHTHDNFWGNR